MCHMHSGCTGLLGKGNTWNWQQHPLRWAGAMVPTERSTLSHCSMKAVMDSSVHTLVHGWRGGIMEASSHYHTDLDLQLAGSQWRGETFCQGPQTRMGRQTDQGKDLLSRSSDQDGQAHRPGERPSVKVHRPGQADSQTRGKTCQGPQTRIGRHTDQGKDLLSRSTDQDGQAHRPGGRPSIKVHRPGWAGTTTRCRSASLRMHLTSNLIVITIHFLFSGDPPVWKSAWHFSSKTPTFLCWRSLDVVLVGQETRSNTQTNGFNENHWQHLEMSTPYYATQKISESVPLYTCK